MTVAAHHAAPALERRRRALELPLSLLKGLFGPTGSAAVSSGAAEVRTAVGRLELDPWVAEQLRRAFAGTAPPEDATGLVAQGAALLVKIDVDRGQLARADGEDTAARDTLGAELMLDLGIGIALTRDLDRAIEEAVRSGGAPRAKELSRFAHQLRRAVAEVKQQISEAERDRAEDLSDHLAVEPRPLAALPGEQELRLALLQAAAAHDRDRLGAARRRLARIADVLPSRTEILVALLVVGALSWIAITTLPRLLGESVVELTAVDLAPHGPVVAAEARPPSLFATVDPLEWEALSDERKRSVAQRLANLLLTHDYRGLLVQLPDGRPVARWLAARGVELIENEEVLAPPLEEPAADAPLPESFAAPVESGERETEELSPFGR